MNCIDVHRKLTAEPNSQDEAVMAHIEQCPACANFLNSIQNFDESLNTAINVDIPDGLAERILLKQSFTQQRQQRSNRFNLYAVAASLLIVLGVSFNMSKITSLLDNSLSLEEIAINHVIDERDHLTENRNIQLAKLNTVLQPFNIKLNKSIGQVNYAGACPIRNSRGVHLVLQKNNSVATLLVIPGEYVTERKTHTKGDFSTTLIPAENGSIAIITEKGSNATLADELEKSFKNAVQYI